MRATLELCVVRIYSNNGKVIGAGCLVSEKHILTCAHVVADALGLPRNTTGIPDALINLDFPLLAAKQYLKAKVVFWQPVNPDAEAEDIAGLELENSLPQMAQPAKFITSEDLWGHPFRVLGFPSGQPNGVSASGVLRGRVANAWVQLEDVKQPGYRLEPGFSGAPIWDEELQGVAGIAVAAEMNRPEAKTAFIIPTQVLIKAWSFLSEQAIPYCPYRGLFAFREEDARYFFGREKFTQQLLEAVQNLPLVAVIGASGSGKSSVVFAGLIPKLRSQQNWLIDSFRPGDRPLRNLAAKLVPLLESNLSETDQLVEVNKLIKALQQGELMLKDAIERILEKNSDQRLLLVADQFEELYTLCQDEQERQVFLEQLLAAVNHTPNFTFVFTLRADFLGYALSYRPFADALQNADVKIGPMNRQEMQAAIEEPAKGLLQIEVGLTERILKDVGNSSGNLALLEFALTQLWAKQSQRVLTNSAYEEIGGVEKALANYAEEAYKLLSDEDKQITQQVFIQLVRPGEGTEDTRRLASRVEVGENNWNLVKRLADMRLVVSGRDDITGEENIEMVHEALIREWTTLRQWMETDRRFRSWQERLRAAKRQWEDAGKDDGALLRGVLLAEAEDWQHKRLNELSSEERVFIQLSLALRDREKNERERRRRRTTLGLTSGFVGAFILAGVAGVGWWRTFISNKNSELIARSVTLESSFATNNELDALLEGIRVGKQLKELKQLGSATANTQMKVVTALRQVVYGIREYNRLEGHSGEVAGVSFSPDGQTIASASWDGTVKIWNREGTLLKTLTGGSRGLVILAGYTGGGQSVSFSPDGQMIAAPGADNTIKLWSSLGKELNSFKSDKQGLDGFVTSVSFSPDGQTIATASADKTIKLWRRDGTPIKTFAGINSGSNPAVFSNVKPWSRDDTSIKTFAGINSETDPAGFGNVIFSPDGQIIVAASGRVIKLWRRDGSLLNTLKGHNCDIKSVTFSPDGNILASASEDKTIKLWRRDGALLKTFEGHDCDEFDYTASVSFSVDGQIMASASKNNTIKLQRNDGTLLKTIVGDSVSFSPDGQTIASTDKTTVKLWKLDGTLLTTFIGHSAEVNSFSFSPDGQTIATASQDDTIKLWLKDGTLITTLKGHSGGFTSLSFSPDGKILASADNDGGVTLWNLDIDDLIRRGCDWASEYLKNNSNVSESDRHLCDGKNIDRTIKNR
jgi:WD40 repeat protein